MKETIDFIATWKKDGFWIATTGKSFKECFFDAMKALGEFIYEFADYSLAVIMVLLLFAMFGSKKAVKGIYWTFATYLIIKVLGDAVL